MTSLPPLTPGDLEVLEFARATWKYPGARDDAILERFGLSRTAFTQRLIGLLRHPDAAAYDPQLVARLRARVDTSRATRAAETRTLKEALR